MYNYAKFMKIAQEMVAGGEYPTVQSELNSSIPGQGPNNLMLQGGEGENSQQNSFGMPQINNNHPVQKQGSDPDDVISILNQLSEASPQDAEAQKQSIIDLATQVSTPAYTEKLKQISLAIDANNDPRRQTINLQTDEKDPTAQQLAKQLAERITSDMEQKDTQSANTANTFNLQKYVTAAKDNKPADEKEKKKTRGNPFRVLMGQVGKLLDHGMGKKDIVKYILRQKHWQEKQISDAVNIVKDYNRKKKTTPKEAGVSFNLARYAALTGEDKWLAPEWEKRSTAELIGRAGWLESLQDFNKDEEHNEGRKAADTAGASSELKAIKNELKQRGFDDSELL